MPKKIFEIDISQFEELQDLIVQYFSIIASLLNKESIVIKKIKLNADSEKITVEGEEIDIDSEDDTEWDFEWV